VFTRGRPARPARSDTRSADVIRVFAEPSIPSQGPRGKWVEHQVDERHSSQHASQQLWVRVSPFVALVPNGRTRQRFDLERRTELRYVASGRAHRDRAYNQRTSSSALINDGRLADRRFYGWSLVDRVAALAPSTCLGSCLELPHPWAHWTALDQSHKPLTSTSADCSRPVGSPRAFMLYYDI
jgi:hypothetical protein